MHTLIAVFCQFFSLCVSLFLSLSLCVSLSVCRVKADTEVYTVAIASIIAKTVRDDLMIAMNESYPQYDFATNKGYNSADHLIAIHNHGACPIHRMSFAALKNREIKVLGGGDVND